MTDKLFLVAFVVLMGYGIYRFGAHEATSSLRHETERVKDVLRSQKPIIEKADNEAIENAKRAEANRKTAEAALKAVKPIQTCRPVPLECLAGLRVTSPKAGQRQSRAKLPNASSKSAELSANSN